MFLRTFNALSFICIFMLTVIGTASAHDGDIGGGRNGGGAPCGWNSGRWNGCGGQKSFGGDPSAPELDPTLLGGGVAILFGSMILLNERRRNRK